MSGNFKASVSLLNCLSSAEQPQTMQHISSFFYTLFQDNPIFHHSLSVTESFVIHDFKYIQLHCTSYALLFNQFDFISEIHDTILPRGDGSSCPGNCCSNLNTAWFLTKVLRGRHFEIADLQTPHLVIFCTSILPFPHLLRGVLSNFLMTICQRASDSYLTLMSLIWKYVLKVEGDWC